MAGRARPNVVLLVMDTARARTVLDGGRPTLDTLARLADRGASYPNAVTDAPWTLPAHASLFTGTSPSRHGAHAGHTHLSGDLRTVAESVSDAGYRTGLVTNNAWVTSEFGLHRGFDDRRRMWQYFQTPTDIGPVVMNDEHAAPYRTIARRLVTGNPVKNVANALYGRFLYRRRDYGAARTTEVLREWIREAPEPFFLFVNYLEPHLEYRPPRAVAERHLDRPYEEAMALPQRPWAYLCEEVDLTDRDFETLRNLYRAELDYLDGRIAGLVEALEARSGWEDTVLVVLGDHGEHIGEHGLMDHQYSLHETVLHVPLVACGGPFTGVGRDERLVQLSDVYPTLLDVLDLDDRRALAQVQGRSFAPGAPERETAISEYLAPMPAIETLRDRFGTVPRRVERFDRRLRAIRSGDRKLVRGSDGSVRLYDLGADPTETTDIAPEEPETVDRLAGDLDAWLDSFTHAETDDPVSVSRATEERLAELGYI